jgi:hypothetical protein
MAQMPHTHTQSYLPAAAALDAGKECPGCQGSRPVHRLPVIVRAPRCRVDVDVLVIQADRPRLRQQSSSELVKEGYESRLCSV